MSTRNGAAQPATRAALDELRLRLAQEVDERVANGMCGCGCPTQLSLPVRRGRRYADERHRQRAYRKRLQAEADALGVPARLSLKALKATLPTGERHGDASAQRDGSQRRRSSRPGVSVYVPTMDAAVSLLQHLDLAQLDPELAIAAHRDALRAAVERRQRTQT